MHILMLAKALALWCTEKKLENFGDDRNVFFCSLRKKRPIYKYMVLLP